MSRYEWREGHGIWDKARGTYLLLHDDEHARILWAVLNARLTSPAREALRRTLAGEPAVQGDDAETLASIRDYLDRSGYKHWVAAFDRAMPAQQPAAPALREPTTEDEAAAMALAGTGWLAKHARHRLTAEGLSLTRPRGCEAPPAAAGRDEFRAYVQSWFGEAAMRELRRRFDAERKGAE